MTQLDQLKEIAKGKDDDKWRATFHRGTVLTLIECLEMAMKQVDSHLLWGAIQQKLKELHHDE